MSGNEEFSKGESGKATELFKITSSPLPFTLYPSEKNPLPSEKMPIAPNLGLHRLQPRALAISRANSRGLKGLAIAVVIPI